MKIYIHYGHKKFNKKKFEPIRNACWVKPHGGFWASAVDAVYGWKDWNEDEHYKKCEEKNSFKFTLSDQARVLTINSSDDLDDLPKEYKGSFTYVFLDFEKIAEDYDAIEVNISSDRRLYWKLYGWDVDSLLVLNPNIIKELSK